MARAKSIYDKQNKQCHKSYKFLFFCMKTTFSLVIYRIFDDAQ